PVRSTSSSDTGAPAIEFDFRDRLQKVVGAPTLQAIARMPDRVKRVLLRGRSITVDGKTLDTTLQLVMASSRLSDREGLFLSKDPATARVRLDATASQFPRVHADVTMSDVSIPGAAADIPA